MSDETTLLPCPFCGGEAFVNDDPTGNGGKPHMSGNVGLGRLWSVECDECGADGGFWQEKEIAIAAWNARASDRHAYEQRITGDGSDWGEIMRGAYDELMAAACESCTPEQMEQLADYISVELGNARATHGTLTAEQVREAIRKYAEDDSCYIFEVYGEMCGPIADELNARAERTCEYVIEDNMNETEGMGDVWFRCTNCDMCFDYADDWLLKMPYCPHCGARVKAAKQ